MYVNTKIISVKTTPGMGEGGYRRMVEWVDSGI
jgi:hypothetical protein